LVEEGESTLRRGAEPKVSRRAVAGILAEASLASASDQALAALLGRARG